MMVPILPTLIQYSPGLTSQGNKARRRIKGIQIGKENVRNSKMAARGRKQKATLL
jgi:hypothetical protein